MNIKELTLNQSGSGCLLCGKPLRTSRKVIVWNIASGELKTESEGLRDERTDAVAFVGSDCAKKLGKYARSTW